MLFRVPSYSRFPWLLQDSRSQNVGTSLLLSNRSEIAEFGFLRELLPDESVLAQAPNRDRSNACSSQVGLQIAGKQWDFDLLGFSCQI